jgi:hypothetical protein
MNRLYQLFLCSQREVNFGGVMAKRLILLAAVAFLIPQLAVAATVTYSTTGVFSSSGTSASSTMPLTFTGAPITTVTTPALGSLIGTLAIGSFPSCPTIVCTSSDTLTITISQTVPSVGTGTVTASVSGVVTFHQTHGTVSWSFVPVTNGIANIGGVIYVANPGSTTTSTGTITADIFGPIFVPEPNAMLLLGLGTLGLMGLAMVSRKMIQA